MSLDTSTSTRPLPESPAGRVEKHGDAIMVLLLLTRMAAYVKRVGVYKQTLCRKVHFHVSLLPDWNDQHRAQYEEVTGRTSGKPGRGSRRAGRLRPLPRARRQSPSFPSTASAGSPRQSALTPCSATRG